MPRSTRTIAAAVLAIGLTVFTTGAAAAQESGEPAAEPGGTASSAETGSGGGGQAGTIAQGGTTGGPRPPSTNAVPCEVAMVVGCVIDGADGPSSVTLQVAGRAATGAGMTGGLDEGSTGDDVDGGGVERDGDRPLQSDLDPWERGGLRSNFGTGSIPLSHYQIGADVTGWLGVPDPLDSFVASQTNWAFTTATFLVILATNALRWAFDFPLAEDLVGDAGVLAQTYTVDFLGFGLSTSVYGLALTVTMIVAGFKAVTKGMIAAGGEVLLAFAAYVVLTVLTLTSGFGDIGLRVAQLTSDVSGSIAAFATGEERRQECAAQLRADPSVAGAAASTDPSSADDGASAAGGSSACSFGFALQRSLVELPYQNLQWGQVLDGVPGKERCAEINLELLREGPWGNSDEPRDRMRAVPQCEENADFNHQATYIRLGIASANTVAAASVTLLVLVISAMLLWQQVKLLFLTVTMPHALVFAILPGRSRRVAWLWIEHMLGVIVRTVVLSLGLVIWLSLFSLIVYEQLTVRGIFLSFFASIAMAVSGFYGLSRLTGLSRRVSPVADRLTDRSSGGRTDGQDRERGERPKTAAVVRQAHSTFRSVRPRPERRTEKVPVG